MKVRRKQLTILLVTVLASVCQAQIEPQLIDEFGKMSSEVAEVRLSDARARLAESRDAVLEFVIHRGRADPPGTPYRTYGIQKGYLVALKVDPTRIIASVCESGADTYTQLWLLHSEAQRHSCEFDYVPPSRSMLFIASSAPNAKYAVGGCCLIDDLGYAGSMEAVMAFGDYLKADKNSTAYAIVYGGTNVYWLQRRSNAPARPIRRLDPPSYVNQLGADIRKRLSEKGIPRSRIITVNGGYRDEYASMELWLIPSGGKRPNPTPNYGMRRRIWQYK